MKRKRLRLEEYDYATQGAYFITVCTKDKRCILGNVVGADAFIGPHVALSHYGQIAENISVASLASQTMSSCPITFI